MQVPFVLYLLLLVQFFCALNPLIANQNLAEIELFHIEAGIPNVVLIFVIILQVL
jgi:hypothetical protein